MMLPEFPDFLPEKKDGKYIFRWHGQSHTFYTDRSGPRDLSAFAGRMSQVPVGHRLIIVAPYHTALAGLFREKAAFVFLSPFSFSETLPTDDRFFGDSGALVRFINTIEADDKFDIFIPSQWGPAQEIVAKATQAILGHAAIRLKTIRHFGRLWPVNFRLNSQRLGNYGDIAELKEIGIPDALVMAGPSLDSRFAELKSKACIWCADTAVPVLLARGIFPRVIFSVDAGFASLEHFVGATQILKTQKVILIADLTGQPAIQRLPFSRILTFASSHPLVQSLMARDSRFTPLTNPMGDVGSLMKAAHETLFGKAPAAIFGHDGGQRRRITHARGTAYFTRTYNRQNRLLNVESYMLALSRRYS